MPIREYWVQWQIFYTFYDCNLQLYKIAKSTALEA